MDLNLSLKLDRDDALRIRIEFNSLIALSNNEERDLGTAPLTDDRSVRLWVSVTGFSKSAIYWGVKLFMALSVKTALLYLNRFTIGSQLTYSRLVDPWYLSVVSREILLYP